MDGAAEALPILVNEVSKIEREEYLGRKRYDRFKSRKDSANGDKPRTVLTKMGQVTFLA